jgi:hypothetical protein
MAKMEKEKLRTVGTGEIKNKSPCPGTVANVYNSSYSGEAEIGRIEGEDQSGQKVSETLPQPMVPMDGGVHVSSQL